MMKMAAVYTVTLLWFSVFTFADSLDSCDYYGTKSENFTVPLNPSLKEGQDLRWIHNKKVIFYRHSNGKVNVKEADICENGSLKLTNLDKSKAGLYTPEVYVEGKANTNLRSIKLCILDRVPVPEVRFQCLSSSVNFICSIEQPTKDVKFEWLKNNKVLKNITRETLLQKSAKEVEKDFFSCKVSNQASSMVSQPVAQNCTGSEVPFKHPFEIFTWIFVGGGGGVVLVLIVVCILCCIHIRRKKSMKVKDEEELRLKWTNTDQHHHHHLCNSNNRHHQQQQPAGHTGPRQPRSKKERRRDPQESRRDPEERRRDPQESSRDPEERRRDPQQRRTDPQQRRTDPQQRRTDPQQRRTDPQQHRRDPLHPSGYPQPSSRRPVQGSRPVNNPDEQLPPLPNPRKKAPPTPSHPKSIGV